MSPDKSKDWRHFDSLIYRFDRGLRLFPSFSHYSMDVLKYFFVSFYSSVLLGSMRFIGEIFKKRYGVLTELG